MSNDYQAILNVIARYYAAIDTNDWETFKLYTCEPIHLDYSLLGKPWGDAGDFMPSELVSKFSLASAALDMQHHLLGNFDVEMTAGDEAIVKYYAFVVNFGGGNKIKTEIYATYEMKMKKEAIWKVRSVKIHPKDILEIPLPAQKK